MVQTNDAVSFGEIQVIPVAEQYSRPEILENIRVYESDAIRFYETHGFHLAENRKLEEGAPEYKVLMER